MKLLICGLMFSWFLIASATQKKKDPRDYTDADLHKLDEQWTEEGEVEDEDLPEHKRPSQPLDMSKIDPNNPEEMLKVSKRHKTLMMFATVSGDPTEAETDEITGLWESMLRNANIDISRFVVGSNRILIKLSDGSYAYEIKDFLIQQDRCKTVTIEGKDYPGKGAEQNNKKDKKETKKKKNTKSEKESKEEL